MKSAVVAACALAWPLTAAAGPDAQSAARIAATALAAADEPGTPAFAQPELGVEEEVAPFDPTHVEVDPGLRFEARAGLWLVEGASRLRTSGPSAGVGLSGRLSDRLRLDGGYLFTWAHLGTDALNVLNTYHALHARLHYAYPLGGAWLTAGAGPVGYVVTSAARAQGALADTSVLLTGGGQLALGAETEVDGRLVRFEVAGASRNRRIDLHTALVVGF